MTNIKHMESIVIDNKSQNKTQIRYLERFSIPKAQVFYRQQHSLGIENCSGTVPLMDLTYDSVRFETRDIIRIGDTIEIEILIPSEEKIPIKGHVVWISRQKENRQYYIVVQFLPFTKRNSYNSLSSRNKLEQIINKYYNPENRTYYEITP